MQDINTEKHKDTKTESITFRTWPVLKQRLEEYALSLQRSVGWVICEQLKMTLSDQEKQDIDNQDNNNAN